jgi:peroxiredoxin/uncharacterized membrane protein YphA (DoxX/SURF4 family)
VGVLTSVALAARVVLAVVFSVAGAAKLADLAGSRSALEGFGLPRRFAALGGVALPVVELAVAVGLLVPVTTWWGALGAIALLLAFMTVIAVSIARGTEPDCHCFGQVHSAPAGWGTLSRNAGLAALGGLVVAAGPGRALSPVGWVGQLTVAELALGSAAIVLAVVAGAQGWFLLQLLRQNGRILGRLESLESRTGFAGDAHASMDATQAVRGDGNGHAPGLAVGAPGPGFELPNLDGVQVSLDGLRSRSRPVLLVFSDPGCGPCNALLPDLAQWQRRHSQHLTIALISQGTAEQNAAEAGEHQLSDVLIQRDREVAESFHAHGTPSAVLVSVGGQIASSLALGPQAIIDLVAGATTGDLAVIAPSSNGARAPGPHLPVRPPGIEVGAAAPKVEWQDLDGRAISLRECRGAPATLIFWNPRCGFCERLLPELKAWHESHQGDEHHAILISSGTVPDNRALGLSLPIVLDDTFQTGERFGVGGTPSAVALDADGRIAGPPAVGGPAVIELLSVQASFRTSA